MKLVARHSLRNIAIAGLVVVSCAPVVTADAAGRSRSGFIAPAAVSSATVAAGTIMGGGNWHQPTVVPTMGPPGPSWFITPAASHHHAVRHARHHR